MFSTPRKQPVHGTISTPYKSPSVVPLNGLLVSQVWHCNCKPRLPAASFEVKSNANGNRGRWFYTCQKPKEEGCGFFLWREDAQKRSTAVILNNVPSEIETRTPGPCRTERMPETSSTSSNKLMADLQKAQEDGDSDDAWGLSSEEERRLVQAVEESDAALDVEPPKKSVKMSEHATPSMKRKRDEDILPTPITGKKPVREHMANVFNTPTSRMKVEEDRSQRWGLRSPSETPSHYREPTVATDVPVETVEKSPALGASHDIGPEVMALLEGHKIDDEVMMSLQELLDRHALKMAGIVRGRDITRVALKAKEAKIAELQSKISTIEAAREMDKTIIKHFKEDMTKSVERRRGRGRGAS